MGNKTHTGLVLLLSTVLLLTNCLPVHAEETAVDLYRIYDMSYTLAYPEDVLETITNYRTAQKYIHMYNYVVESVYDESIIDERVQLTVQGRDSAKTTLEHGYNLSKEEIYQAESDYTYFCNELSRIEQSKEFYEIDSYTPTKQNVPSYADYVEACNKRAEVETFADIGNVNLPMKVPVVSSAVIDKVQGTTTFFTVADGTSVTALFNGRVLKVTSDSVLLDCHNSIIVGYGNMKSISVSDGDTVYQGQTIGKSSSNLKMRLALSNKFVDISKLFVED